MSDTPISDSTPHNVAELGMLCRKLERELIAAQQRIKRLEEAGDVLAQRASRLGLLPMAIEGWHKAKEAKP
jgi:hypothetical protein